MKDYTAYIEKDEDGVFVGSIPTLPGCYSQGATIDELLANLREVTTLHFRNQSALTLEQQAIVMQRLNEPFSFASAEVVTTVLQKY
jgi:predicted RNase H-like HicB family nuclease